MAVQLNNALEPVLSCFVVPSDVFDVSGGCDALRPLRGVLAPGDAPPFVQPQGGIPSVRRYRRSATFAEPTERPSSSAPLRCTRPASRTRLQSERSLFLSPRAPARFEPNTKENQSL